MCNELKCIEGELKEQFELWNTKSLGDVIPSCNYEPMLQNILSIFEKHFCKSVTKEPYRFSEKEIDAITNMLKKGAAITNKDKVLCYEERRSEKDIRPFGYKVIENHIELYSGYSFQHALEILYMEN